MLHKKFVYGHIFSVILGISLGVEFLAHMVTLFFLSEEL